MAYGSQAKSLKEVQRRSIELEQNIRDLYSRAKIPIQGGKTSHVKYGTFHEKAELQVDGVIPNEEEPETIVFVTYTDPDKPGHSNENKLHLKLGELSLFKTCNPSIRCILVAGEAENSWLKYVLNVFKLFFDEVVFTWEGRFRDRLFEASKCNLKNSGFWRDEKKRRDAIQLETHEDMPPSSDFRSRFYKEIIPRYLGTKDPTKINHLTLRHMAISAQKEYDRTGGEKGLFWKHLCDSNYDAIWQERSYFNPMEYTVDTLLEINGFQYEWSVRVPTLLQDLGVKGSRSTEDFGLFSETKRIPVYIQCKASGGGAEQHGKAVMNRAKEQIARSLLYRCRKSGEEIQSKVQSFGWIAVLDGNWRIPRRYPLKYFHMLQFAGYDKILKISDLANSDDLAPKKENPLNSYLQQMGCKKASQATMKNYF
jgi:hypothetical protein